MPPSKNGGKKRQKQDPSSESGNSSFSNEEGEPCKKQKTAEFDEGKIIIIMHSDLEIHQVIPVPSAYR